MHLIGLAIIQALPKVGLSRTALHRQPERRHPQLQARGTLSHLVAATIRAAMTMLTDTLNNKLLLVATMTDTALLEIGKPHLADLTTACHQPHQIRLATLCEADLLPRNLAACDLIAHRILLP